MKYRKKPVTIEAEQWLGDVVSLDRILALQTPGRERIRYNGTFCPDELTIPTPEGELKAYLGDWIIRGVTGELYPCKAGVFALTYELVEESDAAEKGIVPEGDLAEHPHGDGGR